MCFKVYYVGPLYHDRKYMPHIIHIIDELKIGGAQTHLVTILSEMQARGLHQHEVWGIFEDGPIAESIAKIGVPVQALNLRKHFASYRFDRGARAIQEKICRAKPDLVEAHLTWSRILGLWAAWREGVPRRIGFEHGDTYLNSLPFRLANFAGQFVNQNIVVCSRALGDWVQNTHHIYGKKLNVLHNCVDTKRFTPSNRGPRPESWPKVDTLFCAAGTLGGGVNKRMDLCIRAVAKTRSRGADIGLVICGDGSQRRAMEDLINALGLQRAIHILGMRDDVPQIMASCDAFCHAAPFEPFGIVCIEAMASELPVIVPDSGGISEAVDNGKTGWIYPVLETDALAEHMIFMHNNPTRRIQMGKNARNAVLKRFTVIQYVDRLLDLYELGPSYNPSGLVTT